LPIEAAAGSSHRETKDEHVGKRLTRAEVDSFPENVLMGPLGPDGVASFADEPAASR